MQRNCQTATGHRGRQRQVRKRTSTESFPIVLSARTALTGGPRFFYADLVVLRHRYGASTMEHCTGTQLQDPTPQDPAPWRAPALLPRRITGTRVVLRYWEELDAAEMLAALETNRESFLPWLPWTVTHNRTVEQCLTAIALQQEKRERIEPPPDDFTLGIFERESGRVIGGTGLHRVNASAHEAEIGYWVRADRRRQGLCSDAVALLISWAFISVEHGGWGLRRLHIRCAGANISSRMVPEKLKLPQEAVLTKERWVPSIGWDDTIVWGVLRDSWDTDRHCIRS